MKFSLYCNILCLFKYLVLTTEKKSATYDIYENIFNIINNKNEYRKNFIR